MICILFLLCTVVISNAQLTDDEEPASDEQDTFLSVSPDALVVLDLSGSMAWNPAGGSNQFGSSTSCTPDTTKCGSSGCSGGYCSSSKTNCSINCSRVEIAKRALFSVLDDDNNGTINDQDAKSLNVRIGYMRFRNGDDTGGDYDKGNNRMISNISVLGQNTGTSYQKTYCLDSTSCTLSSTCASKECIANASATGGTPLTSSLKEARSYLNAHKAKDSGASCRQKFVILITDGADTYTCNTCGDCTAPGCTEGCGSECQSNMYKRRRAVVAAAKQLYDAGYKVFVVGFGSTMPTYLKNTLNWTAYYGGTDNPLVVNAGTTTGYNVPLGCHAETPVSTACCDLSTNPTACFPSGITSCQQDTATETSSDCGSSTATFKATNNDPGYLTLSGYAFLAEDADQLTSALKNALSSISDSTYAFTSSSIQAVRTVDENFVYEASFTPVDYDSFWKGHLKRFSILTDGSVNSTADWDAGSILASVSSRNIYTYLGGSALTEFNSTNITYTHLSVASSTDAASIITFIRGGEQSGTNVGWKLGDIFHSSPLSIGTPNVFAYDQWDQSTTKAFDLYRADHVRSSSTGTRIILVGANDGQLHAFRTGEASSTGGREIWSFIPPNMLPKLQFIAHSTHPTSLLHHYFVDGPTNACDIWLTGSASATAIGSTYKTKDQWHTYMVMSEGRGGISTLWSSSANCTSGFNETYSATYSHYCGYYAFDITNTLATPPTFVWKLGGTSGLSETAGAHLGQAWSKMFMGRVRIDNIERWVGLIGGGYSGGKLPSGTTAGKGFYVVDLSDGSILWTFTHSGPSGATNGNMDYDLVAGPIAVDSDNDGFWDTAYLGDVGGNIWRFKFCLSSAGTSCGISSWSGGLLFDNSSNAGIRPIYTPVAVSIDKSRNLWVYAGTGDKNDPTASNAQEKLYAIRDSDRSSTYTLNDLDNITSANSTYDPSSTTKDGWYIDMTGSGEKILAEPVLYDGRVYFTTYIPASGTNPCDAAGTARLYIVDYITGAGKCGGSDRYETLSGTGIPSSPIISRNPYGGTTDVYVSTSVGESTVSGGSSSGADGSHTDKVTDPNTSSKAANSVIYWKDRRVK